MVVLIKGQHETGRASMRLFNWDVPQSAAGAALALIPMSSRRPAEHSKRGSQENPSIAYTWTDPGQHTSLKLQKSNGAPFGLEYQYCRLKGLECAREYGLKAETPLLILRVER